MVGVLLMTKWQDRFENYKAIWARNGLSAARKELNDIRNGLLRYRDTFFHQSSPDELSDGDRVMALKDVISELEK